MYINPKYLIYHDLIGLATYAKLASKPTETSFSDIGVVVDDTKNMIITQKDNEIKKYIKKDYIFRFKIPKLKDNDEATALEVNGIKIVGRPENRLRNLRKKRVFKK